MAVYQPDLDLLDDQLRSIMEQTVEDWACLIGVDGPDEATRAFLEAWSGQEPRLRVTVFPQRVGHYRNFERVLDLVPADAMWVALADQDDRWAPEKLEVLVPLLDKHALAQGEAVVEASVAGARSAQGVARRDTDRGVRALLIDNQVTGSFAVVRPSVIRRALPFPTPTDAAYHDHWIATCAYLDGGAVTVHMPLQTYVQHGANVIGESGGSRLRARQAHLRRASAGKSLDYLAQHRWGWRVRMARAASSRFDSGNAADDATIRQLARGTLSARFAAGVVSDILMRRVPPARAAAILVGGGWAAVHRNLDMETSS